MKEYFTMYNGIRIPSVGFGTWQIPEGKVTYDSVLFALENGYRHIDTAYAYGNESSVGRAVMDSGIPREEVFITTKLPAEIKSYEGALKFFDRSMQKLDLGYVDMYLIHAPWPWNAIGSDHTRGNIDAWKGMEEIFGSGRAKNIGISNFGVKDMKAILQNSSVKPMANQIKYFIGHIQDDVVKFCKDHDILVEGYSPLATGKILGNPGLTGMAERYGVTLPQLCIRYVFQNDILPLPKSIHPDYILKNIDINFEISGEDMKYLDNLRDVVKVAW